MRILSVASEVFPLIKTGGLADVAGALPLALAAEGLSVRTLVPGYPAIIRQLEQAERVHAIADLFGGPAQILAGKASGLRLFVIEAPHLYDRPGNPYADAQGRDWPDNPFRFAALGWIAAELGRGLLPAFVPDVVHAHDWQAGLAPAYLHYGAAPRPATVMTVHNVAFQGGFPARLLSQLRLPAEAFRFDGVEYYGQIGFLKAGLQLADRINTVSPTYALEIQSPEAGMGLDGLFRARASVLSGILNGIDTDIWNPARDPHLPSRFDSGWLDLRAENKRALQRRFGLEARPDAQLFGVVSRLSWQKGLDLLLDCIPDALGPDGQLAMLGSGDPDLERGFRAVAEAHRGRIEVIFGYDEALAHLIQGGSDAILVPSRFEPCGLTQLCAMRYGAVPVVSRVGGLADSVIDGGVEASTGLQFAPVTTDALTAALRRTGAMWKEPHAWRALQQNGMAQDLGWSRAARRYVELYRQAAGKEAGPVTA